jgi:hypothetical protein
MQREREGFLAHTRQIVKNRQKTGPEKAVQDVNNEDATPAP